MHPFLISILFYSKYDRNLVLKPTHRVSIENCDSVQKRNFSSPCAIPTKIACKSRNCLLNTNYLPIKTVDKYSKDFTLQQSFTGQGIGPLFG